MPKPHPASTSQDERKWRPPSRRAFYFRKQMIGLLSCLMVSQVYIFLHEAGHALAGMALGYQIAGFQATFLDSPPHVSIWYPPQAALQQAVSGEPGLARALLERPAVSLAGTALPLLAWLLFILLARRSSSWVGWIVKIFSTLIVLLYQVDWALEPLFYRPSAPSQSNDVINFLNQSGLDPRLVSAAALLVALVVLLVFYLRHVRRKEFALGLKSFRWCSYTRLEKRGFWGLAGVFIISLIIGAGGNWFSAPAGDLAVSAPPEGFHLVVAAPLGERLLHGETVHEFSVDRIQRVSYFTVFSGTPGARLKVRLEGSIGPRWTLLAGEALGTPVSSAWKHVLLLPGTYRLVVSPGEASGEIGIFSDEK